MSTPVDELQRIASSGTGPSWRRVRAARRLARVATPGAARALAEVFDATVDERVARLAERELLTVSEEAWNAVCELAITSGSQRLAALIDRSKRLPADPRWRALWLFLNGQYDRAAELDFDDSLLRSAYRAAGGKLRARIAASARSAGRIEWIQPLIAGQPPQAYGDWDGVVSALSANGRWHDLLRLVPAAPLPVAAQILRTLGRRDWRPPGPHGDDGYAELIALAERCVSAPAAASLFQDAHVLLTGSDSGPNLETVNRTGEVLASINHPAAIGTMWRLPDGEPIGDFPVREISSVALALSPDASMLAIADYSGGVRLQSTVDRQDSTHLRTEPKRFEYSAFRHLEFTSDGAWLVGALEGGRIRLWEVASRRLVWSATVHGGHKSPGIAASPGGRLLATTGPATGFRRGEQWRLRLWRLPAGEPAGGVDIQPYDTRPMFAPDERRLVVVGLSETRLLDVHSLGVVAKWGDGFGEPSFAMSADGALLAGAPWSRDGIHGIQVRRVDTGKLLTTLEGRQPLAVKLALSRDARLLAAEHSGQIQVWHLPSGAFAGDVPGDTDGSYSTFEFVSGDAMIARSGGGGTGRAQVTLWRPEPVLLGRTPVRDVADTEIGRLRQRLSGGSDACWIELLEALARWHRRNDIELADGTSGPTDIELT